MGVAEKDVMHQTRLLDDYTCVFSPVRVSLAQFMSRKSELGLADVRENKASGQLQYNGDNVSRIRKTNCFLGSCVCDSVSQTTMPLVM